MAAKQTNPGHRGSSVGNSSSAANMRTVNVALTLHCAVFTIFSLVQYAIFFTARSNNGVQKFEIGLAQLAGSIGAAAKTPCYLAMAKMRKAMFRSFTGRICGH
ncbi:uncharacterized protein LOC134838894 [Symsagittifera roscoffensis]|uniref:uncharacterized protein LOC134838894 n=1 Tax=Symsagittifera roscoffensis TaxID=84072 RepID=UPI00307C2D88